MMCQKSLKPEGDFVICEIYVETFHQKNNNKKKEAFGRVTCGEKLNKIKMRPTNSFLGILKIVCFFF